MPYKPKAPPVMAAPNVIPMADIMLVLLIIFMVVTPMLTKGVSVDMAPAYNPEDLPNADKDDAVVLAVTRDGVFYISVGSNTTRVELSEITNKVKDDLGTRADKTVFIRSDARAKYGDVVKVVDEARAAGVDNVGLLTQKVQVNRTPAAPPPTGGSD
jgi:biopolymer transport protein ExbD/biopolymer transport protein TolR